MEKLLIVPFLSLSCIVDFSDDLKHTQIKSTDKKKHTAVFHKRNIRYNRGLYLTVCTLDPHFKFSQQ